jgi:hypothetical protein
MASKPPDPVLLPSGDLLIPEHADGGRWTTRLVKPRDPDYVDWLRVYRDWQRDPGGLGNWGWAAALLLPPAGVVIGIKLMASRKRQGARIFLTSVVVAVIGIAIVFSTVTDTGVSPIGETETCATTLLGGQELCGEELVAFCQDRYDPEINGDVCGPVLRDAGYSPEEFAEPTPVPPEPVSFAQVARFDDLQGERLTAVALRIRDGVFGGEFDLPASDARYVGVEVRIRNRGDTSYTDFPSAKLRLAGGRQLEPALVTGGECVFSGDVQLAQGDSATLCIPFEVPYDAEIRAFQMQLGSDMFIARWRVTPGTIVQSSGA